MIHLHKVLKTVNKSLVINSRSVVAWEMEEVVRRGWREGPLRGTKELWEVMGTFILIVVMVSQMHTHVKTYQIGALYVNYTSIQLFEKKCTLKDKNGNLKSCSWSIITSQTARLDQCKVGEKCPWAVGRNPVDYKGYESRCRAVQDLDDVEGSPNVSKGTTSCTEQENTHAMKTQQASGKVPSTHQVLP